MNGRPWGAAVIILALRTGSAGAAAPADTTARVLEIGRWYPAVETGITASQSTYSDNWAGGDRGSVVWAALLNASAENRVSSKLDWLTTLKLAYGQTHQQGVDANGNRVWARPEKSTDLVDLESIARFTLGGWVDPFVSGRFESQFQDASDPQGRNLTLNPLRFKESAGIARKFVDREDRQLLSRLGFTFRQSARRLFQNPAPDRATTTETANDGGLEWITDYKAKILQDRVTWTSRLAFYRAVFYSGTSDLEAISPGDLAAGGIDPGVADFATAVDAEWENIFTTQITKLISVNLYLRWIYDKYDNSVIPLLDAGGNLTNPEAVTGAIRKAGQFKETLSLGLTYRFL